MWATVAAVLLDICKQERGKTRKRLHKYGMVGTSVSTTTKLGTAVGSAVGQGAGVVARVSQGVVDAVTSVRAAKEAWKALEKEGAILDRFKNLAQGFKDDVIRKARNGQIMGLDPTPPPGTSESDWPLEDDLGAFEDTAIDVFTLLVASDGIEGLPIPESQGRSPLHLDIA